MDINLIPFKLTRIILQIFSWILELLGGENYYFKSKVSVRKPTMSVGEPRIELLDCGLEQPLEKSKFLIEM